MAAADNATEEKPVPAHIESLSAEEKTVLEKLKTLDDQYLEIEKKYEEELAELQSKYEQKWFPLLDQRAEKLKAGTAEAGVGTPAIKDFWLTALKNSIEFREEIMEWDEPVLSCLENIKYEWLDDKGKKGWKLFFHFAPNDYFTNKVLTKTFHTEQTNEWDTSLEYTKIELAEPIDWKEGKNVTVEVVQKKVKGGGKKKAKAKAKSETIPRPSFFRSFRSLGEGYDLPTDLEDEEGDDDDEMEDKMDMYIQEDYETAEALRDQIIPHAVRYYTGEATPDDDDEDEEDDDDEDEEDDDDDDDEDDDEDESPPSSKPSPKKKGNKPKGGSPAKGGEAPKEECKQS